MTAVPSWAAAELGVLSDLGLQSVAHSMTPARHEHISQFVHGNRTARNRALFSIEQ